MTARVRDLGRRHVRMLGFLRLVVVWLATPRLAGRLSSVYSLERSVCPIVYSTKVLRDVTSPKMLIARHPAVLKRTDRVKAAMDHHQRWATASDDASR